MVSTSVLVIVVLAAFAVMATAIYALAIGTQVDRQGDRIGPLTEEVSGLRAGMAGLDARVATIEQR